jgi:exodeoxyribonuclease V alpha subunit
VGDKVVNNKNDKKLLIVNGDTGIIKDINVGKTDATIEIDFGVGAGINGDGIVRMTAEQFSKVSLAYCTTVHKGQGSEFPVAIIPIHQCHVFTLTRQLIYTGLTRSRQLGLFIGDNRTLKAAIANVGSLRRKTALKGMLKSEFKRLGMTA